MCIPIYTLTLVTDVNVHYDNTLFVDSVEFSRSTSLLHLLYVFTVVDTSHYPGKLTSHIHKCVYNVRLHSNKVTYISSANANNNSILQKYKVQSHPTYNRYTTDGILFTMMQATIVYYSQRDDRNDLLMGACKRDTFQITVLGNRNGIISVMTQQFKGKFSSTLRRPTIGYL